MQRLKPAFLLPLFFSAMMAASLVVMFCVAFAAIIFAGELSPFLPQGIATVLAGATLAGLVTSWFSASRRIVVQPDDDTAPIYAAMAVVILLALPATLAPEQKLSVVLAAIALATIISGLVIFLVGRLKAGSIIQYLPYSVMGGYFAAAGWLLVVGAFRVCSDLALLTTDDVPLLVTQHWPSSAATVLIALVLFTLRERVSRSILLPVVATSSIALFYGLSYALGYNLQTLAETGWLIGPFLGGEVQLLNPLWNLPLEVLRLDYLLPGLATLVVIVLLSVMSLLLTVSGLGLVTKEDIDVNRELQIAGAANIGAGALGGLAAYPSIALSSLAIDLGAPRSRALGILTALLCAMFFYFGLELLGYMPRVVIAGLLLSIGIGFLHTWLVEARSQYSFLEYLVIPIILLTASVFGFLQGILVGLLAAVILFVVKYSQSEVIRFIGDGATFRSNVDRSDLEQKALRERAPEVLILGLQGYLFFGTAGSLYTRIRDALQEPACKARYVVLDLAQVSGADASAGLNFERISQLVTLKKIHLLVAGVGPAVKAPLTSRGFDPEKAAYVQFMPDFDFALEWVEGQLLALDEHALSKPGFLHELRSHAAEQYEIFLSYLQCRNVKAGDSLAEQGDVSEELFLLDDTSASAYVTDDLGNRLRVRSTSEGTVYGEIGFFMRLPRTASIIADRDGKVYILTQQALGQMKKEQPDLVNMLQEHLLGMTIERLFLTTQTLKTVLR